MQSSDITEQIGKVNREISNARIQMDKAKAAIQNIKASLDAIPTANSALITAINNPLYTGALATVHKDQLSKLIAEYNALATAITNVLASPSMQVVF